MTADQIASSNVDGRQCAADACAEANLGLMLARELHQRLVLERQRSLVGKHTWYAMLHGISNRIERWLLQTTLARLDDWRGLEHQVHASLLALALWLVQQSLHDLHSIESRMAHSLQRCDTPLGEFAVDQLLHRETTSIDRGTSRIRSSDDHESSTISFLERLLMRREDLYEASIDIAHTTEDRTDRS